MTEMTDPKFWEALGVQPIVIDPNDDESIEREFDKLDELIMQKLQEYEEETQLEE